MVNNLTESPSSNGNKSLFFHQGFEILGMVLRQGGLGVLGPERSAGLPRSNHSLCLLERGRSGCIHHHPQLLQRWSHHGVMIYWGVFFTGLD